MMDLINVVQSPAMVVTVVASWRVASSHEGKRNAGFWIFLLGNALWIAWGLYSGAVALVGLQECLAAMNMRGAKRTEAPPA